MKVRMMLFLAAFLLAGLTVVWAADVNGKWLAQVPGRGGQTRETTFNFKAEGAKLTGTVSGMQGDQPISDGKIAGDDISFVVVANFQGTEVRLLYKGKITGDEISLTRTREGGDQPGQQFVAKRVK
ncbi:MAG: hypothetical protein ABI882_07830 [Acidobacteriota bacterium]